MTAYLWLLVFNTDISLYLKTVHLYRKMSDIRLLLFIYMVIHKSFRDFRPLQYSSGDGQAEGKHVNRGRETLQVFVLPYRCSICPPLVMRQMPIFWQIPRDRTLSYSLSTPCFVTTAPLAVKPASTPGA